MPMRLLLSPEVINTLVKTKHGRTNANVIYNGVRQPPLPAEETRQATLNQYSLKAGQYIVAVARLSKKGLHDLLAAYKASNCSLPLVLIGDADHPDEYSERLKKQAAATPERS